MALIDKASLLMVPSTYEDGTLYNVLPSGNKAPDETGNHNGYDQTRADFTFSRGSNLAATRVNADGLIEKGRENLLTYSKNLSSSGWTGSGCTSASAEDFEGGNNANQLTSSSANGFWYQAFSSTGVNTISIYAKAGTGNVLRLRLDSSTSPQAYFDLSSGTITNQTNNIDATITAVSGADGWYRCTLTGNISSPNNVRIYPTQDTNVIVYKVQLEKGLVATDYIETGATTATAGVLENTPRIDYSSGAGALLLESQRTNLATLSEYFAGWNNQTNVTINSNYTTSPEGLDNASRLLFTANGYIINIGGPSQSSGTQYTLSCYAKRNDSGTQSFGFFKDGSGSVDSAMSLTNEWQRFDYTYTASNNSQLGLAGLNGADVSVYGFQVEASASYPSSYVPTYGSAATRGADSCSVTGVGDVIGQTEGTLFGEFTFDSAEVTNRLFSVSGAAWSTGSIRFDIISNEAQGTIRSSGVDIAKVYGTGVTINKGDKVKIAIVYTASSFKIFVNGAQRGSTATPSGSLPSTNEIVVNALGGGFVSATQNNQRNMFDQTIVFDTALTDAECVTLTTL